MEIYKATNQVNKKAYVGYTQYDMSHRRDQHYRKAAGGSPTHFHKALRKYNESDWEWEALITCSTVRQALQEEVRLIEEHGTYENGYNGTVGGEAGGGPCSANKKRLLSEYFTGREQTQEHIAKRVAAITGMKHGPKSAEARAKISKTKSGVPWTEARWEAQRKRQRNIQ